jgi:tetratricopeptide (TPR) repeat protein
MRIKIIFLGLLIAFAAQAQNPKADSLKRELARHPAQDTVRVAILNNLAFEKHFSDPQACVQYANQARELAQNLNYPYGLALSYRHTGLGLWTQANLSYALEYFLKGLKIADSLNYTQIQADITGNIGLVYNGLGNYSQALRFFESSLVKQRLLKNKKREIIMLNNMGDCYFFLKDYDKSLQSYGQSLKLGTPLDFLRETNNRNIGNVYEAMGNLDSAMNHYIISRKFSDRFNERKEKAMVRLSIASVLLKKNKGGEAEELVRQAISFAQTGKYRAQLRDAYAMLSGIAKQKGQYKESLEYFQKSICYRDSIQNLVETSRIASVRLEYEMQKKQLEINHLQTDTDLKAKDLSLKNALLYSSIIVFLLLGFFIFTIINNNKLLKARNSEISAQQSELVEKNQQIELVNKKMASINETLEQMVRERTKVLEEQNQKLSDYAFFTAHKLRAPLARVMGLVNLLRSKINTDERPVILDHLKSSSEELDGVVRSISNTLHEGMEAFPEKEN